MQEQQLQPTQEELNKQHLEKLNSFGIDIEEINTKMEKANELVKEKQESIKDIVDEMEIINDIFTPKELLYLTITYRNTVIEIKEEVRRTISRY